MLLPVSNPVNLLAVGEFDLTLGEYLKFLLLPSLLVIGVTIGLFYLIFRKSISTVSRECLPQESVKVDKFFIAVSAGLALTAVGYILVSFMVCLSLIQPWAALLSFSPVDLACVA
jgi:Na+/H+ antiporter NhaD/arsenite permease-like protein